jgi:hypothetical protein
MEQIEAKHRDPESKNRLKQLKTDAQKQIERNKIILKDLINKYPHPHAGPSQRTP